ncbi:MAG: type I-D CRISPR-associated helicase Cas3' [Methanotrichaceae archaeon]|nr:type I-D CRISPR-associated helicase Cas3' [Methanotrichaceae archaeon]
MIIDELALPRYDSEPLIGDHLPFKHQIIARDTIRNYEEFFLFITSPTGSGKTDSWAVPALKENGLGVVIALYPTNALAEDQFRSIKHLRDSLNSNKQIKCVTAETLGLMKDKRSYRITKGEILTDIVRKMVRQGGGIIITNPDIFIYALKGYYYDKYINSVFKDLINTVVFDEFHLYDMRQSDIILFMLHDVLCTEGTAMRKFIFLSATPNETIESKIKNVLGGELVDTEKSSIKSKIVDEKPIMPRVELEFRHAPRFMAGEMLLSDLNWLQEFKDRNRMAIIFDSAHEVSLISDVLRRETGWNVCERSGFRKDSMTVSFDVLIGNKAVEVGIDFKGDYAIQRLVFSGHNVSEFLQRFGRLRNPIPGVMYRSVCFAPSAVVDYFKNFNCLSRQQLEENLRKTMHDPKIASNFRWRYGYLEAYEYIYKNAFGIGVNEARGIRNEHKFPPLTGGLPSDKKDNYFRSGLALIREHYLADIDKDILKIVEDVGDLERSTKPELLGLMEELSSFRGNGIDIAYFDPINNKLGTYNAFFLLRWAHMDVFSKSQFKKVVPEEHHKRIEEVSERVVGYAVINNLIDKPRHVSFVGRNPSQMDIPEEERRPEKVYGIFPVVKNFSNPNDRLDISRIVNNIKATGLFCRYLSNTGKVSKKLYDIDDYIFLTDFKDGSLAIGLDAIYVDCVIHERLSAK